MNTPVYLNALRAFEASARHKSFSAAANELNVTPAAVRQLVRTLEDWLGFPLFLRQTNGKNRLITTELAEAALPDIRAGFDKLNLGLEKLKQNAQSGILTIMQRPSPFSYFVVYRHEFTNLPKVRLFLNWLLEKV